MANPLDLRRLRYFKAIVEHRSLSAAARSLNIAQPALSHHLAELERGLGGPLLRRLPQGVELTEVGEVLLRHANKVLDQITEAETEIRLAFGQRAATTTVRIAVITSLVSELTPVILAAAAADNPELMLHIIDARTPLIRELLETRRADVAIYLTPDRQMADEPLARERLVLAEPVEESVDRDDQPITFREAARRRLILPSSSNPLRVFVEEAARRVGIELNVLMEMDGPDPRRSAVAAGLGATIFGAHSLNDRTRRPRLVSRPIIQPVLMRPIFMGVRPGLPEDLREKVRALASASLARIGGTEKWAPGSTVL